jgi:hypothetical protein
MIAAGLMLVMSMFGCARHRVVTHIPAHCMSVKITDFGAPCLTKPNGDLLCDRVTVRVACVEASK